MDNNKKKRYEAPTLTVVTFKAERGYALSDYSWGSSQFWGTNESSNSVSDYSWGSTQFWDVDGSSGSVSDYSWGDNQSW